MYTMHRSWPRRAFAALMAALSLLTFGVAGEAAHVCPVHDPVLARVATASASAHASSAAHGELEHHDSDGGHRASSCCCTGSACTAPAVALPAHAVPLATAPVNSPRTPRLPEYVRAAASPAYFIPFANGPPLPASPSRSA
jgi:hypothetical protein